jgi:hypothetical protein
VECITRQLKDPTGFARNRELEPSKLELLALLEGALDALTQ